MPMASTMTPEEETPATGVDVSSGGGGSDAAEGVLAGGALSDAQIPAEESPVRTAEPASVAPGLAVAIVREMEQALAALKMLMVSGMMPGAAVSALVDVLPTAAVA